MSLLAEIDLEGNPVTNIQGYWEDILAMIPMIEVINEEILNEPGARFKKERIKI